MILIATTDKERILFGELPPGYPRDHPVASPDQIPVLDRPFSAKPPINLVACNDLSRTLSHHETGVHFYKADRKFLSAVTNPLAWVSKLEVFQCVLTPDITIGDGMPRWQRIRNTVLSRAAGVVWQSRGLNVIPSLRWRDKGDYDFVSSGVPLNSIFSVSNYGSRLEPRDRREFIYGLHAMVERLEPQVVLVFGTLDQAMRNDFESKAELVNYVDEITKLRRASIHKASNELFQT